MNWTPFFCPAKKDKSHLLKYGPVYEKNDPVNKQHTPLF